MKKNIKRIFELIFAFMIVLQNFCYADLIKPPSITDTVEMILAPVAFGVIIVSLIAIAILHFSSKQNKEQSITIWKKYIAIAVILVGLGIVAVFGYAVHFPIAIIPTFFSIIILAIGNKNNHALVKKLYIADIILIIITLLLEMKFGGSYGGSYGGALN